ncbi:MAG TPA: ABC transporter ATP-binding protein [Candidatus Binatia bacterium]|nr:ABC transporter ATP-binding protein [Candidatus Binatia bacterium]
MIEAQDLRKTYDLDHGEVVVEALRGLSFAIAEGELVSIMGASGSGKSTLLNILGCLDHPTSGRYLLAGRDASALDADERAEVRNAFIGFVFQSFNLLARTTAIENVELPLVYGELPRQQHRARAEESLAAVGLAQAGNRLPTQLSGGQQQRVAIARALVNQPRVLLADEPTGNLDSVTSAEVMALLRELNRVRRLTLLVVTHDAEVARQTDRVLVLRDGSLVADGPPAQALGAGTGAEAP